MVFTMIDMAVLMYWACIKMLAENCISAEISGKKI